MKFEIKNCWSGSVIFTAEIEATEDTPISIKLGLAVKVAVENRANLVRANLYGANLVRANLDGANLYGAAGNNRHVKTIQAGQYVVTYTDTIMQIGCQRHTIEEWFGFDNAKIAAMDGKAALKFWNAWKPILQQITAASPAEATGYVAPQADAAE